MKQGTKYNSDKNRDIKKERISNIDKGTENRQEMKYIGHILTKIKL